MKENAAQLASKSRLSLVYIVGRYPLLTTTFIDREIKSLRQDGVDLQVVAVRQPPTDMPLSAEQRALQEGVLYMLPVKPGKLLLAALYYALLHPLRFFGALAFLLSRPHPSLTAWAKSLLHFGQGVYTAYLLRGRSFDELHAHFIDRAATIALITSRLLGVPYSLSIHAGADVFVHPVLVREKLSAARMVVSCTNYNKKYLEKLLGQDLSEKITCIPHGLDGSLYQPEVVEAGEKRLILGVGQLAERKGFAYLIEACRRLDRMEMSFECQIVGEGPQRRQLQDLIDRYSLTEKVHLTGALAHEKVLQKYRQAALLVMPCIQTPSGDVDGIPNVLLEAMAMQVPVISTAISAIPELIQHEWNGLLVPQKDAEALTSAIVRLLEDPGLRTEIARRGRQAVLEKYDVKTNIRRLTETLWPDTPLMKEVIT